MLEMSEALPPALKKGIEEFNRRDYFQCHETLEELWHRQGEPERQFTQGIIQIAVAYHHLLRGNQRGARKLFRRGLERLTQHLSFAPAGVDVTSLIRAVQLNLGYMETTTPSRDIEPVTAKIDLPAEDPA